MAASGLLRRALRFGITGVGATGVHLAVAVAMVNLVDPSPMLANATAFVVATVFSYLANTLWSFAAPLCGRNLLRYATVVGVGFCVAIGVSGLAEMAGLSYLIGIALVAVALPALSFVMHNFWTYS